MSTTLGLCYLAFVAGPLWNARGSLSGWTQALTAGGALPQPAAIGIALLGAASLVFVIGRMVRELELNPYAAIAPILTVFAGLVLSSVRGQLPFPGVGGEHLGLVGLVVALLGGGLLVRPELGARVLGWTLVALPTVALALALTAVRGESDPFTMLARVEPALRSYLTLLAVSSFALAMVGVLGRRPRRLHDDDFAPATLRLPSITPIDMRISEPILLPPPRHVPANGNGMRQSGMQSGSYAFQHNPRNAYVSYPSAVHGSPSASGTFPAPTSLALDDPDLIALTRKRPLLGLASIAAAVLAAAAVGGYFLVIKPERDRVAQQERARSLKAAQERMLARERENPTGDLEARMSRFMQQRQQEQGAAPLGTTPVVTPLNPPAAARMPTVKEPPPQQAVAAAAPTRAEPQEAAVEPPRERHHRHHARRERESKAEPKLEAKPEPRAEPKLKADPEPKPALKAAPAAKPEAPKKTQNENDLDLDDLVQKALKKGGNSSSASDDPILGL